MTLRSIPLPQKLSVVLTLCALIALTLQYPLATTFPIGGDLTRYALQSEAIQQNPQELFTNTDYPATIALITIGRLLPGDWPSHLTAWLVIAHISAGLALAAVCFQLGKWPAASVALFLWSLTLTGQTGHIEDATLAQLMSITPLLLLLITATKRKIIATALLLVTTFLIHPFSGFMALSIIIVSSPLILQQLSLQSKQVRATLFGAIACLVILFPLLRGFTAITNDVPTNSSSIYLADFVKSRFGPFILLAPVGFLILLRRRAQEPILASLIITFTITSILLAFNDNLGPTLYAKRFVTYFILAMACLAAIALPRLLKSAIRPKFLRFIFTIVFGTALVINSWRQNASVFRFYESPSRYARIHPDELAAIDWMKNNITSHDVIASTRVNRHSEWIPLLTDVRWQRVQKMTEISDDTTHVVFFLHREDAPTSPLAPPLFENRGAVIYSRQALNL